MIARVFPVLSCLLAVSLLAACGDDRSTPPSVDAGVTDAGDASGHDADTPRDDAGGDDAAVAFGPAAYIKASNTDEGDLFGISVSLSADGTHLAVGTYAEASSATGIDGDQADNSSAQSGAVYVFSRAGTTWAQEAYVKASNTGMGDLFGISLALSADGTRLAVGAGNQAGSGAAYVFSRVGSTWTEEAYLKASNTSINDGFGMAVSLSPDGTRLAVGAPDEDSAATGVGGDQTDNSASSSGAVYVFARSGSAWTQEAYVKASNTDAEDAFGGSVSLSADGARLAVAAGRESSAATAIDGDQADDSAMFSGAVYVFARGGTVWTQEAYVKASNAETNDRFGGALSLSADGARLAVGAGGEASSATGIGGDQADNGAWASGAAYVFSRTATTWRQDAYFKASNAETGDVFAGTLSLSADGNRLAVGARSEASSATGIGGDQADNSSVNAGAVYVFSNAPGGWIQYAYVKASNTDARDGFGVRPSLSRDGTLLAVGAPDEASAATGANGDQTDNSAPSSGAVYIY